MIGRSQLTCVVPTAGRSPYLADCVSALLANPDVELLIVAEEGLDLADLSGRSDLHHLIVPPGTGFARACNRALTETTGRFVALVNDDALVAPDWSERLVSILHQRQEVAAAQGTIVSIDDSDKVDGCGIGWNRHWQAIQLDRGAVPDPTGPMREVFGVSGTAAIFRRSALEDAAIDGHHYFEPRLDTYYEDVELACRLRSRGFRSILVPGALARHGGGSSSSTAGRWRWSRIYGNRLLVLARLWGRTFPARLPSLLWRDTLDLGRALVDTDRQLIGGIVTGWGRAVRYLSHFAHTGPAMLPMTELRGFLDPVRHGGSRP